MPLSCLCEFPSNFIFINIEHVSFSNPNPLECNEEVETTLQIAFANLVRFGGWEGTCKIKSILVGHVHVLLLDKNI
jgi:hypothetical protein